MPLDAATGLLLRDLVPQVVGVLVRRYRDFSAVEDAVQDALLDAVKQWPNDGIPENPRAWMIQVASRRFADHVRGEVSRRRREYETAMTGGYHMPPVEPETQEDDALILLFLCCHPSLTDASAIALTLRVAGGLTTAEIAAAFLVPEATMAQRISRAKQIIQKSDVPFSLPARLERADRLRAVLHVLYLIFNEGYTTSHGAQLQRPELADEAIRLARILHRLTPEETESAGLLALMLLTDARRTARTGVEGELISLDKQDRSLWNRERIAEGVALLSTTLPKGAIGPYQLQAAIAAVHDESPSAEQTDWPQILALYEVLIRISAGPMVRLNHAIAWSMVHGAADGLRLLAELESDSHLAGNHRLDAVRAHLLERSGDITGAVEAYRLAASRTTTLPERNYLITQAARLTGEGHLRT